ncbi:MAG: hypothetical protein ACE14S_06385 [Candidatus Bathyarchaeia archaeon]
MASELGLPTVDAYTALAGHPELFSDGVHPNSQGSRTIANQVYNAITKPETPNL